MPISESDPRVFFAAERTLLAWIRTGLTIMGLGFVVSRFGLFLRILALQSQAALPATHSVLAADLGVAFVMVGSISVAVGAIQHRRFVYTLPQADLPLSYSYFVALWLSFVLVILGIALAAYLVISSR